MRWRHAFLLQFIVLLIVAEVSLPDLFRDGEPWWPAAAMLIGLGILYLHWPRRWPQARVIILTTFDDEYVFEGLRAGVLDYLLKDVSGQELAEAVRTVAAGGALVEPSVARKVLAEFVRLAPPVRSAEEGLPEPLTEREREVVRLLAKGLTNREIAERLSLAEGTVKNFIASILQKLGVRDRTQAAVRAHELGVI